MAGNNRNKKFSVFNFFKPSNRRGRRNHENDYEGCEGAISTRKVRPTDDEKMPWAAEPGIDRKASAFITKFHETRYQMRVSESQTRVSESERQAVSVPMASPN